jgi:hypothetical protein
MKKGNLLSTLLLVGAFAISAQGAFAADCSPTASQVVTGTLATCHCVEATGTALASGISCDQGTLSAPFTPAFKITTNSGLSQAMNLKAEANTLGGVMVNALAGDGNSNTTYIALTTAGETGLPGSGAVTDALGAGPTANLNGNVIAYGVTKPADVPGDLVYTWNVGTLSWDAALTQAGETLTSLTVPAAAAKTDTFSFHDEPGLYQATVTLSFVS